MSAARDPIGRHVTPPLTPERLSRQWAAIEPRLSSARSSSPVRVWALPAFAAVAVASLVLFVTLRHAKAPPMEATLVDGTWLESPSQGAPTSVVLREGSHVSLGARSRVRLAHTGPEAVELDLERGRVDVEATHVAGRSFVVVAKGVEVHVVGTKFSVEADNDVRVRVLEGRVRVNDPAGERFVSGGEEWVAESPPRDEPPPATPIPVDVDATAPLVVKPAAVAPSAKELLESAQRAVGERRFTDAAKLLDAIRHGHSKDPRAALAAFQLGRLRLDSLGDPRGAEEAFSDAMRLSHDANLRDDAEARRVEALDRQGARAACDRAKSSYLVNHPQGVHVAEVKGRCGGP